MKEQFGFEVAGCFCFFVFPSVCSCAGFVGTWWGGSIAHAWQRRRSDLGADWLPIFGLARPTGYIIGMIRCLAGRMQNLPTGQAHGKRRNRPFPRGVAGAERAAMSGRLRSDEKVHESSWSLGNQLTARSGLLAVRERKPNKSFVHVRSLGSQSLHQ